MAMQTYERRGRGGDSRDITEWTNIHSRTEQGDNGRETHKHICRERERESERRRERDKQTREEYIINEHVRRRVART